MYCRKCGVELVENAKFCQKCGCPVEPSSKSKRADKEYAGKMYKCPNCGEIINSFEINCPACGYELRGVKATHAVREFALKLEVIESQRRESRGMFKWISAQQTVSKTDEQKINLIKSFSVPNSKEDMLEFMILATSNIKLSAYDDSNTHPPTKAEKDLNSAWLSKADQVYEKARISYSTDDVFQEIDEIYSRCKENIKKTKKKSAIKLTLLIAGPISGLLILNLLLFGIGHHQETKRIRRLEKLEITVQEKIDAREYPYALSLADSIDYQGTNKTKEREWDIQHDYWVDKVLKEAKDAGVYLEYSPSEDVDNANATPEKETQESSLVGTTEIPVQTEEKSAVTLSTETVPITIEETKAELNFHIKKEAQYTNGQDEWNMYCAKAITDSVITIEKWEKTLSSDKNFDFEYEVGSFKINDPNNGFKWIDDNQSAFSITFRDEKHDGFRKQITGLFILSPDNAPVYKGSLYSPNRLSYEYNNDDWHLYKAIQLSDTLYKIECWYRSMALGSYYYGYDVALIDLTQSETDFEWADETQKVFTITIRDENNSHMKKDKFVAFKLQE